MCKMIKIQRDVVPDNIDIEFERDASLQATEIVVINKNLRGDEWGVKLICFDNGMIKQYTEPRALTDGVDII